MTTLLRGHRLPLAERDALAVAVQPQLPAADDLEWMTRIACRNTDPEMFHPVGRPGHLPTELDAQKAVTFCRAYCPVIAQCQQMRAQLHASGVWGGVWYPTPG